MTAEEFSSRYPRLYHTSLSTSIDSFRRFGLLSAKAITELPGIDAAICSLTEKRTKPIAVEHFVLRDQATLKEPHFGSALKPGITRESWCLLLNEKVFFFPTVAALEKLLNARAYKKSSRLVLEFDTLSVLHEASERAFVTSFNVGAALFPNARLRCAADFIGLAQFQHKQKKDIAEVALNHRLGNFARHYISHRVLQPGESW